jgi:hypothetical protein
MHFPAELLPKMQHPLPQSVLYTQRLPASKFFFLAKRCNEIIGSYHGETVLFPGLNSRSTQR